MTSRVATLLVVLVAGSGMACTNNEESAEEYARRQAEKARDPVLLEEAVKIEAALPSDVHLECATLFPVEALTGLLEEKEPVSISDLTDKNPDSTATCSIRRGGKPLDQKAQERIVERKGRLGVMGGDELCNVTVYCAIPADEEGLKERCETEGSLGNHTLGVFSCVKATPKGADYGYTYKLIDADSKCTLVVRGGPSVIEEPVVQTCSRAAMELVTADSLKTAK